MQQIEGFLRQFRLQGKSAHTLDHYQMDLYRFVASFLRQTQQQEYDFDCLLEAQPSLDWSSVEVKHIKLYVMEQMRQGKSARTLARHLSALRRFFHFLIEQGVLDNNPAKAVKAPKQPQSLPKSIDIDQTRHLLEQPIEGWHDIRDQAMFELLYSGGLRVAELVDLDMTPGLDQLASGRVQVLGKGKKMRVAMVGQQAQQAMAQWLNIRGEHAKAEETAVFVSQRGTRLTTRSVQLRLDKRALQAQVASKMSPHRLRHACATHVLESSGDLRAVQEMLGHANLSTTQIYTQLDLQHLAQVYDQAHPRARKKS